MVIFLHGPDTFRIHERLAVLQAAFRKKYDTSGYQVERFEATKVSADQLRQSLLTPGLFTVRRCIVFTDIFTLPDALIPLWLEATTTSPSENIIIATSEKLPKTKSELKTALLKASRVEEYTQLKPAQLPGWIKGRFAQHDVTVTSDAIAVLVESLGADLWSLHQVIAQLSHFSKRITAAVVQQFVASPLDDNIFHLTDALAERDTKKALQLLHDQLTSGVNHFYLLTMLARQISILIRVKEPNGDSSTLHPFVVKKAQHHARHFSLPGLVRLHQAIVALDATLKSSSVSPELLFDRFIVQCTLA